jgi:hypothetical protein
VFPLEDGTTSSTRNGKIGMPLLTERSISLRTCADWLELAEKTRMVSLLVWIASTIDSAYSLPGSTSRGAIQQRMQFCSSVEQTALAIVGLWTSGR